MGVLKDLVVGVDTTNERQDCYCGECGRLVNDKYTYECRTHSILCEDCLKMLHKRYV